MTDTYVCEACIEDDHLAEVIREHADSDAACDYCEDPDDTAAVAPLDEVIGWMRQRIHEEWCDPAEELPYNGREGGYQGNVLDSWEMFGEIGWEPSCWALYENIVNSFTDEHWCKLDYFTMREDERLVYGWEAFSRTIKHSRRYTFWTMGDVYDEESDHPDYTPVGTFLHEVGRCIRTAGLIREIPAGEPLWRVRVHKPEETITTGRALGSPPLKWATQPNRMSPEGVSMFYGSQDFETACLETVDPDRADNRPVTGGVFRPVKSLQILDLGARPEIPSFWAEGTREIRMILLFLHEFRRKICQQITRGGTQHLDYVPTQAFTEYVRFDMKTDDAPEIHGICYPSSRNGRPCYVIFADNDQCHDPDGYPYQEQLLSLDSTTLRTIHAADVADMNADPLDLEEDGE